MSRIEWILSGILILLLLVAALIGWLWWQQRDTLPIDIPSPLPTRAVIEEVGFTALAAYGPAAEIAANWASDAQLVSATATWPNNSNFSPVETGWSFIFYSAQKRELALFSVINGKAAQLGRSAAGNRQTTVSINDWQVDSVKAIEIILAAGGRRFIDSNSENGDISLTLTLEADSGLIVWKGNIDEYRSGRRLVAQINANSGELLLVEERP
jgi:hypothetical protein